jgi:hypothetical protein
MDTETFWRLIEATRRTVGGTVTADYDDRMAAALKIELVQLPADEIMDFDYRLIDVGNAAQSVDMEAAAHLVSNIFFDGWHGPRYYCFINGVILLGRETFERAARYPDSLADHSAIQAVAAGELPRVTFVAEEIYDVAGAAYCHVEGLTVDTYLGRLWGEDVDGDEQSDEVDDEDLDDAFDEDDEDEDEEESYYGEPLDKRWTQRLPRLSRMFGPPGEVNTTYQSDKLIIKSERLGRALPRSASSNRDEPTMQTDDVFNAVLGQEPRLVVEAAAFVIAALVASPPSGADLVRSRANGRCAPGARGPRGGNPAVVRRPVRRRRTDRGVRRPGRDQGGACRSGVEAVPRQPGPGPDDGPSSDRVAGNRGDNTAGVDA